MSSTESLSSIGSTGSVGKITLALFSQTLNLAEHMQDNAGSLYTAYVTLQGEPYSDPDFIFNDIQVTNLPTSAITYDDFLRQSDDTRLRKSHIIYITLSRFLQVIMEEQRELYPAEDSLTAKFEEALGNMDALVSNVSSIMDQMGIPLKSSLPDPLVLSYDANAAFQKKLRGYVVCREYKTWILRTTRDFEFLNKKYGGPN